MLATAYRHSIALLRDVYTPLGHKETTLINPLELDDSHDTFTAMGAKCTLQVQAELERGRESAAKNELAGTNTESRSANGIGASAAAPSSGGYASCLNSQMEALDDALARMNEVSNE